MLGRVCRGQSTSQDTADFITNHSLHTQCVNTSMLIEYYRSYLTVCHCHFLYIAAYIQQHHTHVGKRV